MTAESREELISAYLDGELSAEVRADVEKWLAESSQLRQLHDELRALRTDIQSLPRHTLDHDLSGSVVRRSEQSVLRGHQTRGAAGPVSPSRSNASWWNRGAGWRRVVWPVVAVAAALAILVYDAGQRGEEREVAQGVAEPELPPPALQTTDEDGSSRDALTVPESAPGQAASVEDLVAKPEMRSRSSLREKLPKSAAGATPPEPASGAAAGLLKSLDNAGVALRRAGSVVLEVSPAYLRDKRFEKLLDQNKIKWQRLPDSASLGEAAGSDRYAQDDAAKKGRAGHYYAFEKTARLSATYLLDTSRKQADELVAGLKNVRQLEELKQLKDEPPTDSAPRQDVAAAARGRVMITLVAPAQPARPQSAPPAAPADAKP